MFIYIFVYLFGILSDFNRRLSPYINYFYIFLVVMIVGFRGQDVGTDTIRYHSSYSKILSENFFHRDFLYNIIVLFSGAVGGGIVLVKLIYAFIAFFPVGYLVSTRSYCSSVSYGFYFASGLFAFSMSGMRQAAAIGAVSIFFYLFLEKRYRLAVLSLIVSVGLHASALVAIFVLPLMFLNFGILLIALASFWILSIFLYFYGSLAYALIDLFSGFIPERFQSYLLQGDGRSFGPSDLFDQIIFVFAFYACLYVRELRSRYFIILFLVSIILGNMFSSIDHVRRLAHYFLVFGVLALPISISVVKGVLARYMVCFFVCFLLSVQFIFRTFVDPYSIVPYSIFP